MSYLIDGGAHIDHFLTGIAIKGFTGRQGFIGDQLFPVVPVAKQSNVYPIIDPDTWLLIPDTRRAPGTPAKMSDFKITSDTYFAHNYAFGTDYPLEELAQNDIATPAQQRAMKTNFVLDGLARDRERRIANLLTSISNVGSGVALTGTDKWSDYTGSDPIGDVKSGTSFMQGRTGLTPNTLAMDFDTHQTLKDHPDIRDYVKYTQGGPVTDQALAAVFRVQRLLVADGIFNSAKEGATASMQSLWGNFATLMHIQPGAGMETITFGLAYRWTPAEFPRPMVVERYMHHNRSAKKEVQEAQYFQDEVVVAKDLAYTINTTL